MSRCAWPALAIITAASCGKAQSTALPPSEPVGSARSAAAAPPEPASPVTAPTTSDPASPAIARGDGTSCAPLPFAATTSVPEPSGGAWLTIDGKPALVVVGDSGNHGAYGIIDPETGATVETGTLPMSGEAGDDLEGLAERGGKLYGLISSGWMRVWRRTGKGFELVDKPYPLGPVELTDKGPRFAPGGGGMVCGPRTVNCGRNYEGLCLAPAPKDERCIGFAASKADGHLYCLSETAGRLVVHHDRAIAVTRPGALADCAFGDDGTLWAGSNMFDLGRVYRVTGWDDPATAKVESIGPVGVGFPELIAARGDAVYRMSDMGGSPSMMAKYRCTR